ncbi:MAG TPA: hypothetical protein VM165_15335 [Planctomycetaceae bacterium]|nr:hypothetical protein [Planctomycetaceae bacterium]
MTLLLDDEAPQRKTREECLVETPPELQTEMMSVLQSSGLVRWIVDAIERAAVAGEHLLALVVYLTGTSRLLAKPLAVIVQGPSASGESFVIERVGRLFPPEAVLFATDFTPQALYYLAAGELKHRFIVAGERSRRQNDETAQATKCLRELIASGRVSKLVTITDQDGPRTAEVHQEGPIAYVESTTAPELFEEDANRCLTLQPDERREQTRRISEAYGRQLTGELSKEERELAQQQMQCLHRLLEPLAVVVPYGLELVRAMPDEPIEVRRVCGLVGSMIQVVALLHQHQRGRDDLGRVIAQPEDYWLARQLLGDVLARCLGGKPADALRRFVHKLCKLSGEFTSKEIATSLKMSDRTVRESLNTLLTLGLVKQTEAGRGPIPARWLIADDIALRDESANPLPPVGAVCGIDESVLVLPELPADELSANSADVPF